MSTVEACGVVGVMRRRMRLPAVVARRSTSAVCSDQSSARCSSTPKCAAAGHSGDDEIDQYLSFGSMYVIELFSIIFSVFSIFFSTTFTK